MAEWSVLAARDAAEDTHVAYPARRGRSPLAADVGVGGRAGCRGAELASRREDDVDVELMTGGLDPLGQGPQAGLTSIGLVRADHGLREPPRVVPDRWDRRARTRASRIIAPDVDGITEPPITDRR